MERSFESVCYSEANEFRFAESFLSLGPSYSVEFRAQNFKRKFNYRFSLTHCIRYDPYDHSIQRLYTVHMTYGDILLVCKENFIGASLRFFNGRILMAVTNSIHNKNL